MNIQEKIDTHWSRSSAGYSSIIRDELASFRVQAWLDLIQSQMPLSKDINVLDIEPGRVFSPLS